MSVRPQEAAETASRFSLRSVFAGSFEEPLESPKLHATPAPSAPPMQVPALNIATNPNSALKFTLPQMRSNATLEAVGGTAVYLASDAGACTTGEIIRVDGGYHILGMPQPDFL